jgi:putative peptidoglycan lipid II flippase
VVVVVERIIASFLPPGTLTALNYAFKILSSLAELLAGSVGTAALAPLARAVALKAEDSARHIFQTALEISLALVSPVLAFCLLLDRPIMRLIFERGNFTPEATALMSTVFFYYSFSLPLIAAFRLLGFYLFARQEMGWFVRLALFYYGLVVVFDLLYVGVLRLGPVGIPLSLLTTLILTMGLALYRNIAGLRADLDRSVGVFATKNLLGCALAGLAVWALRSWMPLPRTGLDNLIYLVELCGAGTLVFFGTLAASRAVPLSELTAWRAGRQD